MNKIVGCFLLGFVVMLPASVYIYILGVIRFNDWFWPLKKTEKLGKGAKMKCPICSKRVQIDSSGTIVTHTIGVNFGDDSWWTVLCPASGKTRERAIQQSVLSGRKRDRVAVRKVHLVKGVPYATLYGDFLVGELLVTMREMESIKEA